MKVAPPVLLLALSVVLLGCGDWPEGGSNSTRPDPIISDNLNRDTVPRDSIPESQNRGSAEPVPPALGGNISKGNVTTYSDVDSPAPSRGGACNFGVTGILNFAAINVDAIPGDSGGQWHGGKACGQSS